MFYVYVLRSEPDDRFYIGYTANLKRRLIEHNSDGNTSTRGRRWTLVYYEAYKSTQAARERERILKHDGRSRRALMDRIKQYLE